eukprot:4199696-Prymnesium_polylepis.1
MGSRGGSHGVAWGRVWVRMWVTWWVAWNRVGPRGATWGHVVSGGRRASGERAAAPWPTAPTTSRCRTSCDSACAAAPRASRRAPWPAAARCCGS